VVCQSSAIDSVLFPCGPSSQASSWCDLSATNALFS
jgi:hypothetical protein